jgi:tRNA (guanine-N7-)-methyltransferase
MLSSEKKSLRRIRSFIRRQGRITQGQQFALDSHWDKYCLDPTIDYDFNHVFGRVAPLIVEIGFGTGDCLAMMAAANPDINYIGFEVHRPGVGHLMLLLEQQGLSNVRIYCHDAIDIIEYKLPDHSLVGVHLFFPDPWPKKKAS